MNHLQLHDELSSIFMGLKNGTISPKDAKEFANLAGKIINNSKAELAAIAMGHILAVPLLGLTEADVRKTKTVNIPRGEEVKGIDI